MMGLVGASSVHQRGAFCFQTELAQVSIRAHHLPDLHSSAFTVSTTSNTLLSMDYHH